MLISSLKLQTTTNVPFPLGEIDSILSYACKDIQMQGCMQKYNHPKYVSSTHFASSMTMLVDLIKTVYTDTKNLYHLNSALDIPMKSTNSKYLHFKSACAARKPFI